MIRRLLCWLGDLFKKDWHSWEHLNEWDSEYDQDIIHGSDKCKYCGKVRYYTRYCKRVK